MLKTIQSKHNDCLEVRFREKRFRQFITSSVIAFLSGLSAYFLPQLVFLRGFVSLIFDLLVIFLLLISAAIFLFSTASLVSLILRKRFFFHYEGIDVHTAVLGITLSKRWFDNSQIYDFGFGLAYHGQTPCLKFAVENKWIFIVSPITEEDASQFVSSLVVDGYRYSTSRV